MADNVNLTAGDGTIVAGADVIGGVSYVRAKQVWGPDGTVNDTDVASGKPLPVQIRTATGTATPLPVLGTAGTASADVITVQGIASGTVIPVSDGSGSITVDNAGTFATQSAITAASGSISSGAIAAGAFATGATSIAENEDVAASDGDRGVKVLVRRANTAASSSGTDGDYQFPITNTRGALWMAIEDGAGGQVTSFSGPTQYTEDVASASDPVGSMLMAVRRDTLSTSEVSADGDNIALKASNKGKLHVAAEVRFGDTVADVGSGSGGSATQRVILDTSQLSALSTTQPNMAAGFQAVGFPSDLPWPKGVSNRVFVAAFTTLTRPANTTAYVAGDSISDNATAGSVTALSATVSDINDDPVFISEILINSTDTGLAGKRVRAYLYNADPTASTGVVGGDNAAFSNKKNGYIGSFSGVLESGFSDGTVGRLVPTYADGAAAGIPNAIAGGFICVKPTSGAKTFYIQYQAVDGFTPSANSTTIIGTARGWQGRAS